jgi:hypothetical protein
MIPKRFSKSVGTNFCDADFFKLRALIVTYLKHYEQILIQNLYYEPLPPTLRLEVGDFSVNMLNHSMSIAVAMVRNKVPINLYFILR